MKSSNRIAIAALLGSFALAGGVINISKASEVAPTPFADKPDDSPSFDETNSIPPGLPPHWDLLPQATRSKLLSIHHGVLTLGRISGPDAIPKVLAHVMGSSEYPRDLRLNSVRYVQEMARWDLLPALFHGLAGSLSDEQIRNYVASTCLAGAISAPKSVPSELKSLIANYLGSGLEADPAIQRLLSLALDRLP